MNNKDRRQQFRDSVAEYHADKQLTQVTRFPLSKSRTNDDEFIKDLFAGYGMKVEKIERGLFRDKIAVVTKDQQLWVADIAPQTRFQYFNKQELVLEPA